MESVAGQPELTTHRLSSEAGRDIQGCVEALENLAQRPNRPEKSDPAVNKIYRDWFDNVAQTTLLHRARDLTDSIARRPGPPYAAAQIVSKDLFPLFCKSSPRLSQAARLHAVQEGAEAIVSCDDPGNDEAWNAIKARISRSLTKERLAIAWALQFSGVGLAALQSFALARPWARGQELLDEVDFAVDFLTPCNQENGQIAANAAKAGAIIGCYQKLNVDLKLDDLRTLDSSIDKTIATHLTDQELSACQTFLASDHAKDAPAKLQALHNIWNDLHASPLLGVAAGSRP